MLLFCLSFLYFYPRSPCGERRPGPARLASCLNFYPRSPCGERLINTYHRIFGEGISIHALLAESDAFLSGSIKFCNVFLSTLSLRRATDYIIRLYWRIVFLSTLSLRRATIIFCKLLDSLVISIHALLAESDVNVRAHSAGFNVISIHALLAESDVNGGVPLSCFGNFYPRSPCGERLYYQDNRNHPHGISIHALLAESDGPGIGQCPPHHNFYPRSPCGERLYLGQDLRLNWRISIHALLAESDIWFDRWSTKEDQFLSTLSLRRATRWTTRAVCFSSNFYPRSPCGERRSPR